jgi:hypothetical protein
MFITTLPIIFALTHLFSFLEASIFLVTIFLLVYYYTPGVTKNWSKSPDKNFYEMLRSAWLGKVLLWQAFWPFFIVVNIVLYYIDYRIADVTYTIASWKTVHGMLLLPIIWWINAVWRCSQHTHYKIYSVAARTLTVYLLLDYVLRFIISTQYPITLFDCRLLIMEYGDCL